MAQSSRQTSDDGAPPSVALRDSGPQLIPPDSRVIDDMGKLNLDDDHAVYTGSSHWVTILEDVSGFARCLYWVI